MLEGCWWMLWEAGGCWDMIGDAEGDWGRLGMRKVTVIYFHDLFVAFLPSFLRFTFIYYYHYSQMPVSSLLAPVITITPVLEFILPFPFIPVSLFLSLFFLQFPFSLFLSLSILLE